MKPLHTADVVKRGRK